ncbi:hypothetical protein TNCT_208041 [Trichonephila clavata]|uniref:Uncharacterized protein n=1 Tax=Trichonephila clavata TaxID=2740835 RepID=A0A8X6H199_TRICU|nr:hypothetical protein TNCT_208041 [Trichonephila clavata]
MATRMSSSMNCLMMARAKSVRTLSGRPELCSSLVDSRPCEAFLPTLLLYGMVGHYSQGLPQIHCDIHLISPAENDYFDVSALHNTGYFHLTRHSPTD